MIIIFAALVNKYHHLFMASVLSFALGLIVGPVFIVSNTVVHLVSDEKMRGKVFSALEIVIHFAFLAAMLASSFINKYVDAVWILISVGVLFSVAGVIGLARFRKSDIL